LALIIDDLEGEYVGAIEYNPKTMEIVQREGNREKAWPNRPGEDPGL
jgi:hypothetical protein